MIVDRRMQSSIGNRQSKNQKQLMADETKPQNPSAPPTGANPAATPHVKPAQASTPDTSAPTTAAAAAATGAPPVQPGAHAARPAPAPRPPAAAVPDLAGKTTTVASAGGAAAVRPAPAAKTATAAPGRDPDDTSPLLTRRAWIGLAWGAFSAASAAALAATGRFMFPNVLNEPPQQF